MLMGGLAKLDAKPGGELQEPAPDSLHTGLQEYGHQALVNSRYCHAPGMMIALESNTSLTV